MKQVITSENKVWELKIIEESGKKAIKAVKIAADKVEKLTNKMSLYYFDLDENTSYVYYQSWTKNERADQEGFLGFRAEKADKMGWLTINASILDKYSVVSGDTYEIKEVIKAYGFKWDKEEKAWKNESVVEEIVEEVTVEEVTEENSLTGSEKQVNLANIIKTNMVDGINKVIGEAKQSVQDFVSRESWEPEQRESFKSRQPLLDKTLDHMQSKMLQYINSQKSAKFFVDHNYLSASEHDLIKKVFTEEKAILNYMKSIGSNIHDYNLIRSITKNIIGWKER